ncbi:hypothetical protein HDU84_008331 [Entophlyctis sp. JEL0112]|nr:hypothetical protein HDU84_008331 [Entophlyctis sp. JEL0112]
MWSKTVLLVSIFGVLVNAVQQFTLGTWFIDTWETPATWNAKTGYLFSAFQAAQNVPFAVSEDQTTVILDPLPDQDKFLSNVAGWDDHTNASVFMTIYNYVALANGTQGFDIISDESIIHLATRLGQISGRTLFVRWLPEMNGNWMPYGQQPAQYVATWKRMYPIMKNLAPGVQLVWSPNYDLKQGDTSYWPGAEYVDYVGTSVYWKDYGIDGLMPNKYISTSISTVYNEYAVAYNKSFWISECSGAWETGPGVNPVTGESFTNVTPSVTQAEFQSAFWRGVLNESLMDSFPLLVGAFIFEVAKSEEFYTDFRVTNDSSVRSAFLDIVDTLDKAGRMVWASPVQVTSTTSTTSTTIPVAVSPVAIQQEESAVAASAQWILPEFFFGAVVALGFL